MYFYTHSFKRYLDRNFKSAIMSATFLILHSVSILALLYNYHVLANEDRTFQPERNRTNENLLPTNQLDEDLETRDKLLRRLSSTMLLESLLFKRPNSNNNRPSLSHLLTLPILDPNENDTRANHTRRNDENSLLPVIKKSVATSRLYKNRNSTRSTRPTKRTSLLLEADTTNQSNSVSSEQSIKDEDGAKSNQTRDSFSHKSLNYLVDKLISLSTPSSDSSTASPQPRPPTRPFKPSQQINLVKSPFLDLNLKPQAPALTLDLLIKDEYDSRVQPMYEQLKNQQSLLLSSMVPNRSTPKADQVNHRLDDAITSSEATTTTTSTSSSQNRNFNTSTPTVSNGGDKGNNSNITSSEDGDSDDYDESPDSDEDKSGDTKDDDESAQDDGGETTTPKMIKILRNVPPYQLGSYTGRPELQAHLSTPDSDSGGEQSTTITPSSTTNYGIPTFGTTSAKKSLEQARRLHGDKASDASSRDSLVFSDGAIEAERKASSRRKDKPTTLREKYNNQQRGGYSEQAKNDMPGESFLLNQLFSTISPLVDLNLKLNDQTINMRDPMGPSPKNQPNPLIYKGYVGKDDYLLATTSSDWSRPISNNRDGATTRYLTTTSTTPSPATEPPTVPYNYYLNQPITNAQSVPGMVIPASETPPHEYNTPRMPSVTLAPSQVPQTPPPSARIPIQPNFEQPPSTLNGNHTSTLQNFTSGRMPTNDRKYSYQLPDNKQHTSQQQHQVVQRVEHHMNSSRYPSLVGSDQKPVGESFVSRVPATSSVTNNSSENFWSPTKVTQVETTSMTTPHQNRRHKVSHTNIKASGGTNTSVTTSGGKQSKRQPNSDTHHDQGDGGETDDDYENENTTNRIKTVGGAAAESSSRKSSSDKSRVQPQLEEQVDNVSRSRGKAQDAPRRVQQHKFINHEPAGSEMTQTGLERLGVRHSDGNVLNQTNHYVRFQQPKRSSEPILISSSVDNNQSSVDQAMDPYRESMAAGTGERPAGVPSSNPNFFSEASFERPVLDNSISMFNAPHRGGQRHNIDTTNDPYQRTSSNTILSTVHQPVSTTSVPTMSSTGGGMTTTQVSNIGDGHGQSGIAEGGGGDAGRPSGKSSNDRLAFILIGGSCVLSVVCLVLAAMSMRCQDMCDDYHSLRNAERAALKLQKHRLKFTKSHQINKFNHGLSSSGSGQNLIDDFNIENNHMGTSGGGANNASDATDPSHSRNLRFQTNAKSIQFTESAAPKSGGVNEPSWNQVNNVAPILNGGPAAGAHRNQWTNLATDSGGVIPICGCDNCTNRRLMLHDDFMLSNNKHLSWLHPYYHMQHPMRFRPLFGAGSSVSTFFPQNHVERESRGVGASSVDAHALIEGANGKPSHSCGAIGRSKSILSKSKNFAPSSTSRHANNHHLDHHASCGGLANSGGGLANVLESANSIEHDHAHHSCCNHDHHKCHNHHNHHHHHHHQHQDSNDTTASEESETTLDEAPGHCEHHAHHCSRDHPTRNTDASNRVKLIQMAKLNSQLSSGWKKQSTTQLKQHAGHGHSGNNNNHHHHHNHHHNQHLATTSSDSSSLPQCTCVHQPLLSAATNHGGGRSHKTSHSHHLNKRDTRDNNVQRQQAKRDKSMLIWSTNRDRLI